MLVNNSNIISSLESLDSTSCISRSSSSINNDRIRSVEVIVEFIKFGEIDTMNEKYHVELNVEIRWTESIDEIDFEYAFNEINNI